jgi:hypothetical protein
MDNGIEYRNAFIKLTLRKYEIRKVIEKLENSKSTVATKKERTIIGKLSLSKDKSTLPSRTIRIRPIVPKRLRYICEGVNETPKNSRDAFVIMPVRIKSNTEGIL